MNLHATVHAKLLAKGKRIQRGTQMIRALCLAVCFLALAGCRDQSNNGVKVRAPGVDVDVQPKSDTGKAKVKVEIDKR
jgi:hypothetical protein